MRYDWCLTLLAVLAAFRVPVSGKTVDPSLQVLGGLLSTRLHPWAAFVLALVLAFSVSTQVPKFYYSFRSSRESNG
jgi:hypothetical protein